MIKINLLPIEKRKAERTPLPRFILISATAGVATLVIVVLIFVLLKIKFVGDEIKTNIANRDRLKPQVDDYDKLAAQKTDIQTKINELKTVTSRDLAEGWWHTINAIWDVIQAHPKVWIDDIRIQDERSAPSEQKKHDPTAPAPPYSLTMKCHVAGSDVEEMSRFRNGLKANPVLLKTLPTVNFDPEWKVDPETDYAEPFSISFSVALFGPAEPPKPKVLAPAPVTTGGAR